MLRRALISQIQSEIQTLQQPASEIEFEVKFGSFDFNERFRSRVDFEPFQRLQEKFQKSALPHTFQHITDYIATQTHLRKQVTTTKVGTEKVVFQRKEKIMDLDIPEYDIRISANSEIDLPPIEDFLHTTTRFKDRHTYIYKEHFKVDLTHVSTIEEDKEYESYEVEVEVMNIKEETKEKLATLNQLLKFVFLILYDTHLVYTMDERRKMSSFINRILGMKKGSTLRYGMVAKARNLKFRDLRYGGMVYKETEKGERNYYSVTHKADGIRKFLIINRTGVWLCFPPKECNLVYRFTKDHHDLSLDGLVLDGEYIPKGLEYRRAKVLHTSKVLGLQSFGEADLTMKDLEFVPDAKYWFLVFDVLAVDKNKDVQYYPHSDRMKEGYRALHRMEGLLDNKRLVVHFKSFLTLKDRTSFFEVMQRMFTEKEALPYADDGLIFMSEMAPYNPIAAYQREHRLSKPIPLYKRNLVDYDDICKWKPPSQLTIDFSIEHKGDGSLLLYALTKNRELELFEGTSRYPFHFLTQVEDDSEVMRGLPTGAIVEFMWDVKEERFVPIKHRSDKRYPNSMVVAQDVWTDVHQPITEETLRGLNFGFLRKFHNGIKRDLYKDLETLGVKTIVDIGSGRGGDVLKWHAFDQVLAIEPDEEHILELKHRLAEHRLEYKVYVVQAQGQDTEIIRQAAEEFFGTAKADAVTLMLSMTFFWKTQETLTALATTIDTVLKDDGILTYMVMDGDAVEEMLNPYYPSLLSIAPETQNTTRLRFIQNRDGEPFASLSLQPLTEVQAGNGRQVEIYIRDSIVGRSSEPLPVLKFNDLPILYLTEPEDETLAYGLSHGIPDETLSDAVTSLTPTSKSQIIPQVEWLVHLDDLNRTFRDLGREDFRHVTHRATQNVDIVGEMLLNDAQQRFTSMYSYGHYFFGSASTYDLEAFFAEYNRHYPKEDFEVFKAELEFWNPLREVPITILQKIAMEFADLKTRLFLASYDPRFMSLHPSPQELLALKDPEFKKVLDIASIIAAKQNNKDVFEEWIRSFQKIKPLFVDHVLPQSVFPQILQRMSSENVESIVDTMERIVPIDAFTLSLAKGQSETLLNRLKQAE
jgi:hypothetical protein